MAAIEGDGRKQKYRRVAYYPGCALEGTGHAYNRSTKAVGKALGLALDEVPGWNCCGAMEVKNVDPKIQTYLSQRVLSIAANEMKADVVMAPCNGCYHNLKKAEYDLGHDASSRDVVDRLARKAGEEAYRAGDVETIHALDWIKHGFGEGELRKRVKNALSGLKVANYYGCMYTRPRHIFPEKDKGPGTESTLQPHYMDDLLEAAGADVIATECPTCHSGLEMHQVRAEKVLGRKTKVKMLYFTQLLGIALGLSPRAVGVQENVSDGLEVLKEKSLA